MNTAPPFRNLPPLAGICSLADAMQPGLTVEQCVARLKRLHYAFKRLHQIFTARLTAEPIYELKMAFSLHAHLCAEHTAALRKRVAEMREPPLGLDAIPHPALEIFFDEILATPDTATLILGLYEHAVPTLVVALEQHLAQTNHLADHPSVRLCRFALLEMNDVQAFGKQAVAGLVQQAERDSAAAWSKLLTDCLAAAGQLHGPAPENSNNFADHEPHPHLSPTLSPPSEGAEREKIVPHGVETGIASGNSLPARLHSAKPFQYDPVPRRDERFPDPYNMGVNAEVFLYDKQFPPEPKTLMMFYKRLREIDVPEMMASIIVQTPGQPWEYYRDMTRQLWDEARHAMMGEVGFASLEIDWPAQVIINFTWSLALNTQLKPIERHAVLYFIEQGLMPRTGKRFEWETAQAAHNPLAALFQDYDWADEVLHARIGRDWYLKQFKNAQEAVRFGDECWSRVLMNWESWREKGLTEHRNWWPGLYRAACEHWGIAPDPKVLAYDTTYQTIRADLKNLVGSA